MDSQKILLVLECTALLAWLVLAFVEFRRRTLRQAAILCVLRGASLLLLFWVLHEFWLFSWRERPIGNSVVLLEDLSESMELLPRKERDGLASFAASARKKYSAMPDCSFREYVFASKTLQRNTALSPSERKSSALGEALLQCALWHPSSSIILISDGRDNSGVPAAAIIPALSASGVRVFPADIADGKASSSFDLVMGDPECAATWQHDATIRISGALEKNGLRAPDNCSIDLMVDGQLRESKNTSLPDAFTSFEFNFPASSLKPGWHEYRLIAKPLPGELSTANNTAQGIFRIQENSNVIVLWEGLNSELRALQPLLKAEYGRISIFYAKDFASKSAARQKELLASCGLLILGNVTPESFHPDVLDGFFGALKKNQGALIFLHPDALPGWLADKKSAEFLPVSQVGEKFARTEPLFLNFVSDMEAIRLPLHSGRLLKPKTSSELKLSAGAPPDEVPLVLNLGRVTCFAGIGSWRWQLSQDASLRQGYERFWRKFFQSYDFLMQDKLALSLDEGGKGFGGAESRLFRFSLADMEPQVKPASYLLLKVESGREELLKGFSIEPGRGGLSASCEIRDPGIHWFFARKADNSGRTLSESSRIPVLIRDDRREMASGKGGPELLALLARSSGGAILPPAHTPGLPLEKNSLKLKCRDGANYARELFLAALAFASLACEWFLRQRWSSL